MLQGCECLDWLSGCFSWWSNELSSQVNCYYEIKLTVLFPLLLFCWHWHSIWSVKHIWSGSLLWHLHSLKHLRIEIFVFFAFLWIQFFIQNIFLSWCFKLKKKSLSIFGNLNALCPHLDISECLPYSLNFELSNYAMDHTETDALLIEFMDPRQATCRYESWNNIFGSFIFSWIQYVCAAAECSVSTFCSVLE